MTTHSAQYFNIKLNQMRLTLLIGKTYRTYKRYLNNNTPDVVIEEK
ncbi:9734_t:CDS:2 [Acaulospora colombiana]|uniref:9734_t:CDS:1 n=1 Tax=Acaulospora colombiana TaxID=27376 RepID=A0ACA9LEZ1_9GLOM|nr:9734_t:CDS:2 [Acaulospora colombiana]